jgi:hypothetical protein
MGHGPPGEAPAYAGTAFIIAGLSLFRQATVSWTLPRDILHVGLANCGGRMFRGRSSCFA